MTQTRAPGRKAQTPRPPPRPRSGSIMLTGRGAAVALFAMCFSSLLIAAWTGWGLLADVLFVMTCGLVACYTRASGLRGMVLCPPLAFFAGTVLAQLLVAPDTFSAAAGILVTLGSSAPWLFTGTGLTVAIALGRGWRPGVQAAPAMVWRDRQPGPTLGRYQDERWLTVTNEARLTPAFQASAPRIDTGRANVARAWNYMVGGKDNFEADREAARQLMEVAPVIRAAAPASRAFLGRAVRYLAGESGIRQFLDVGTGLPTAGNTHEVAQSVAPECRVVYVDNDPVVLTHARALLTSLPEGVTSYIDADAREPGTIISHAGLTLNFGQPVAVMMVDLLNFIDDDEVAGSTVFGADRSRAAGQLPGHHASGQRPGSGPARGRTALEPAGRPAGEAPLPPGGDRFPGGSRAGGAGPGDGARVAA